jgi:hypothetical protein
MPFIDLLLSNELLGFLSNLLQGQRWGKQASSAGQL